jgi:hypothetical protein
MSDRKRKIINFVMIFAILVVYVVNVPMLYYHLINKEEEERLEHILF